MRHSSISSIVMNNQKPEPLASDGMNWPLLPLGQTSMTLLPGTAQSGGESATSVTPPELPTAEPDLNTINFFVDTIMNTRNEVKGKPKTDLKTPLQSSTSQSKKKPEEINLANEDLVGEKKIRRRKQVNEASKRCRQRQRKELQFLRTYVTEVEGYARRMSTTVSMQQCELQTLQEENRRLRQENAFYKGEMANKSGATPLPYPAKPITQFDQANVAGATLPVPEIPMSSNPMPYYPESVNMQC